ncbi:MAG: hypothetical protein A2W26_08920 [Acidobacteria bacterium RBG_16_64_8]|nr:MAG: hypothetical protein A2W26_08920 [Acidobacteria bacterium RBG_16_64_8]
MELAGELLVAAPESRPLPAIYELVLPERASPLGVLVPAPPQDEPVPQFGSAEERIAPFGDYLGEVARRAGVGTRNAIERAAQLMEEILPADQWSGDAERQLRSVLSTAWLELPFIRPRASVARRAAFYAAAELADAGRVERADLEEVEWLCAFYDEELEGLRPLRRDPGLIPPITLGATQRPLEWVTLIDADFGVLQGQREDGRVVLAEWTTLKTLDWGSPSELREVTARARAQVSPPSHEEQLFGRVRHTRVVDYAGRQPEHAHEQLIVQNYVWADDTLGVRWIAFNPMGALSLGWRPANAGLFRWNDSNGEPTVETVWWQDGTAERRPPHLHEEVGYGWLVVASAAALQQLRDRLGSLHRLERITRKAREQDEGQGEDVRSRARAL